MQMQGLGKPQITESLAATLDAKALFAHMGWGDTWPDAALKDVVIYLRGCSGLHIPASWRPYLPTEIPSE
jgi:hypothetical protein